MNWWVWFKTVIANQIRIADVFMVGHKSIIFINYFNLTFYNRILNKIITSLSKTKQQQKKSKN